MSDIEPVARISAMSATFDSKGTTVAIGVQAVDEEAGRMAKQFVEDMTAAAGGEVLESRPMTESEARLFANNFGEDRFAGVEPYYGYLLNPLGIKSQPPQKSGLN